MTENYTSFKICLHVATAAQQNTMANYDGSMIVEGTSRDAVACPELMMALKRGEWLRPDESSCLLTPTDDGGHNRRKGLLLPIKDISLPMCGVKMLLGMGVNPF